MKYCWPGGDSTPSRATRDARLSRLHTGEPGKLRPLKHEEEAVLLRFYGGKAQDMCRAFQFPPKVAAAAVAYLARFYTGFSTLDHHPRDVMLTAIYLACKVGCALTMTLNPEV